MSDVLGVILAGGLSRRMNGVEKSLLELNGKPLIQHVKERMKAQVDLLLINANGDPERFARLGTPVQSDTVEGFAGPLAGVLAGMRWAQEHTSCSHIVTAAADTPFFPNTYVEEMLAKRDRDQLDIVLASSNGRRHPVFGLWPVALSDPLEEFLVRQEERKVMLFVERYKNSTVEFETVPQDPFFNVNTPEELALAEELVQEVTEL